MKVVTTQTRDAWLSGEYTGPSRPMTRVVVQKLSVLLRDYTFADRLTAVTRSGQFASALFGQQHTPVELPNLAFMRWSRDVSQDAQTAELRFFNTMPLQPGEVPSGVEDFDRPGWYTGEYGSAFGATRWGHSPNEWNKLLVPDRILKTYEGYGFDPLVAPEDDPHMYPSGIWLIDDVDYEAHEGMITVTCRDFGRLLLEQIHFPPIVPLDEFPIHWDTYREVDNPDITVVETELGDEWISPTYETDSNQPYVGAGITDGGRAYVQANGAVEGHHGSDAFDGNTDTYFLSVGNQSTWSSAYEYVQGKFKKGKVGAVKVNAKAGPYICYVSIYADGEWKGSKDIPYGSRVIDTNADIPYVKRVDLKYGESRVIKLPKVYAEATKVRITFSRLWNSGIGVNYKYRAAIQEVKVLKTTKDVLEKTVDGGKHWEGTYEDFTDIVKWICAWAGFFLPKQTQAEIDTGAGGANFIKKSTGDKVTYTPAAQDVVLGSEGVVWGDFENTGTSGQAQFGADAFNFRPLMDAIVAIRDIVPFSFWIDETGGAIWRTPNVWSLGNYVMPVLGGPRLTRTAASAILDIDERTTLTSLRAKLSSRNMRERVVVANVPGKFAAASAGFVPYPSNMRRVTVWSDQHWGDVEQAQIAADLVTVRQAWTFRENTITIAANPEIQIDDQIRIYERTSEEGYYHYVKSITSEWSLAEGTWRYNLSTHWLGEDPTTRWAFDKDQLAADTQTYLTALGVI